MSIDENKMYNYFDGSGNKYVLRIEGEIILEYVPIKPFQSSSGIYDGGDFIKKIITKLEYDEITSILEEAIQNEESHVENRVMMSGMIKIEGKSDTKICIIRPNSEQKDKIEKKLHELIKN